MNRRTTYMLFPLLMMTFCVTRSGAQRIQWSPTVSEEKKYPYLKILGAGDEGYFLLRSNLTFHDDRKRSGFRSRRYVLQCYNDNLTLKWSEPLTEPCDDCSLADVGLIGTAPALLISRFNKQSKLLQLEIQKLGSNGKPAGAASTMLEIPAVRFDEENQPDLIVSRDELRFACASRSISRDKENQHYSLVIFDTSLQVLGRKEIDVPIKARLFSPISAILTDEGNFYLLGIEFKTEKKVRHPGESFYKLISYNLKRDEISFFDIKLENQFLTDVTISADNRNRKIVVSGFYSDKTTYSTAGVFYYGLNEDSLVQPPVVTSTFNSEFLRKLTADKGSNKELVNYSIDRSVLRQDGGAAIVAESYYITTRSYWDYYLQTWVYHYYYHYGNIIALSINPDGKILWSNVILKDQNSTDDGGYYSSYFSFIMEGKILAIYNKYISDQSSVLLTSISGTGQVETKTLFQESENVAVSPHAARQVDEETVLMPAERDGEPYLIKIVFD